MLLRDFNSLMTVCIALLVWLLISNDGLASDPPGVVISEVSDFDKDSVSQPSLAIEANGDYVASHTFSNPKPGDEGTVLYSSSDRGLSWKRIGQHPLQKESTLFVHQDDLYLMGIRKSSSDIAISRSSDGGKTWTQPLDENTGLLTKNLSRDRKFFTSAVPVLIAGGRIYRDYGERPWKPLVVSAAADSDLLQASNWTLSNSVKVNPTEFGRSKELLLAGSVLQAPNGSIVDFLTATRRGTYAAILPVGKSGSQLKYDSGNAYVEFPFNEPKNTVRYDEVSKRYWSIGGKKRAPFARHNISALVSSADLINWEIETILLQHVDSSSHGFRSADWQFDGEDIVLVNLACWDKSPNNKKMGYVCFHRFKNFRDLTMEDSAKLLGPIKRSRFLSGDIEIEGINFSMERLSTGEDLFSNTSSKPSRLPQEFRSGWKFTQVQAGNISELSVKAKRDTDIYFSTVVDQDLVDVTGWNSVPNSNFQCKLGALQIFKRATRAGETIQIPSNRHGGLVLVQSN